MITRRNRIIGIEVSCYPTPDEDPSCRWQNDCEHGNCVGHRTRKLAMDFLSVPWEWCEMCRALYEAKMKEASIKSPPVTRTEGMIDCTLPAPARFNVLRDASGTAYVAAHPRGKFLQKDAQEVADLENGIYRVVAGGVEVGYVKFTRPGAKGAHVAYVASAPNVGKEFDNLRAAIDWVRGEKS